jgi:hypothetical protein
MKSLTFFFLRLKPAINKRKRTDHDDIPNKRKIANNKLTKNDSDDDERLILSPRISPIISKFRRSFSSMVVLLLILMILKIIDLTLDIISMSTLSTMSEK